MYIYIYIYIYDFTSSHTVETQILKCTFLVNINNIILQLTRILTLPVLSISTVYFARTESTLSEIRTSNRSLNHGSFNHYGTPVSLNCG